MTDRPAALRVLAAEAVVASHGDEIVGASDPAFADAGAEGYLPVPDRVELGLEVLRELLEGAVG